MEEAREPNPLDFSIRLVPLSVILTAFFAVVMYIIHSTVQPMQHDIERNSDDIKLLRADQVPRKEHEKDWMAQARQDENLQRQMDALRQDLGSGYGIHDALTSLNQRIDKIDEVQKSHRTN